VDFQAFFVGIESKVAAGVRVEEVGYQLQFSKQELRKVVKEYSGREVCSRPKHRVYSGKVGLCYESILLLEYSASTLTKYLEYLTFSIK